MHEVRSLEEMDDKVQQACKLCREKLEGVKACDNAVEWAAFLDDHIYHVISVAEQDVKDACRRISSTKGREKKSKQAEENNEPDGKGENDECDDDADDSEESG